MLLWPFSPGSVLNLAVLFLPLRDELMVRLLPSLLGQACSETLRETQLKHFLFK